jgi:hypothetical protein
METKSSCFQLQCGSSVAPQSQASPLSGGRFLASVAECEVDWGEVSVVLSKDFLELLRRNLETQDKLAANELCGCARNAFASACNEFELRTYPNEITAQFIATVISGRQVYCCWIGAMWFSVWKKGEIIRNRPHIMFAGNPIVELVSKAFRERLMDRSDSNPECIGPFSLEHPSFVYISNRSPDEMFHGAEGSWMLQNVLESKDDAEFLRRCREAAEWVSKMPLDKFKPHGVRSILMSV